MGIPLSCVCVCVCVCVCMYVCVYIKELSMQECNKLFHSMLLVPFS
jgi:hypothetical protein